MAVDDLVSQNKCIDFLSKFMLFRPLRKFCMWANAIKDCGKIFFICGIPTSKLEPIAWDPLRVDLSLTLNSLLLYNTFFIAYSLFSNHSTFWPFPSPFLYKFLFSSIRIIDKLQWLKYTSLLKEKKTSGKTLCAYETNKWLP